MGEARGGRRQEAPEKKKKKAGNAERTYVMVKPDGVQRGLVAEVIKRFSQRGYKLCGLKMLMVERSHAEKHYADLSIAGKLIGATNPLASEPGTIRGDFCI